MKTSVNAVRRILLSAILSVAFAHPLDCFAGWKAEDSRVSEIESSISIASDMLSGTTNESERAIWQERLALAKKELDNVKRTIEIEKQEAEFTSKRRGSADASLREVLGTIETDTSAAEKELRSLQSKIRSSRQERQNLIGSLSEEKADESDETSKARARLEARIRNVEAQVRALMAQRDAIEFQIRLARDAQRIVDLRRNIELNPKASIKLISERRQSIATARRSRGEFSEIQSSLEEEKAASALALQIEQQKFSQMDEEISLLKEGYKIARKSREPDAKVQVSRLRRLVDVAESEKDLMQDRLEFLKLHVDELDRAIGMATQGYELFDAEQAYLKDHLGLLVRRYVERIIVPIVAITIILLLGRMLNRRILPRFFSKDQLFIAKRLTQYIVFFLVFMVIVTFFFDDLKAIATILGLIGAAIVIALQDLCTSFAGWFVIVSSGKMRIGDRVEIDGHTGDVIDIQMLRTTLTEINNWLGSDENTGRIISIPNSFIFKNQVFNYAHVHRLIWDKIDVTVTYETQVKAAYQLLLKVLEEETAGEWQSAAIGEKHMEERYGVSHAIQKPRIDTFIADSGITFRLFYPTHYSRRSETHDRLSRRIAEEVERNPNIDFAYPTRRQISMPLEPKGIPAK